MIGIILIVVGHVVQTLTSSNSRVAIDYTIPLWNATLNPVVLVIYFLRFSGLLGNFFFLFCSIYFLSDSKGFSGKKLSSLISDSWIISVVILLFFCVFRGISTIDLTILPLQLVPVISGNNWYITCYVVLYAAHPFLNRLIAVLTKRQHLVLSCVSFFYYCLVGTLFHGVFFSNVLVLWISIYFTFTYLKKYCSVFINDVRMNTIILIVSLLCHIIFVVLIEYAGTHIPMLSNTMMYWFGNQDFVLVFIAFSAFNIVRNLRIKGRIISYLSTLSLLVYIIHDNQLIRTYLRPLIWQGMYERYAHNHILLQIFAYAAVWCTLSFLLSILYNKLFQKHIHNAAYSIAKRVGIFCDKNVFDKIEKLE